MKQNERSIVRKRTQQLVYLELGRDNGGVMLNLSEEGCGFQAISPVKLGRVRFAFQISGGRRISGDAEVEWADEAGIMGGLRFLDLHPDARKQIRMWLDDTNAPEEPGEGVVSEVASNGSGSLGAHREAEAHAHAGSDRGSRRTSYGTSAPVMIAEPPPAPPWTNPLEQLPVLEEERERFPLLRGDGASSHARAAAIWRGVAGLMAVGAIAVVLATHPQELGSSLIWIGQTLSGRTNTSVALPENKPASVAPPASDINPPLPKPDAARSDPAKTDDPQTQDIDPTSNRQPDITPQGGSRSDTAYRSIDRSESVLEQQSARQPKSDPPLTGGETVESLWGAVQAGSVAAEISLAERFVYGDGVLKNCDQARVLMRAAANKGNREARLRLYELESGGCQ